MAIALEVIQRPQRPTAEINTAFGRTHVTSSIGRRRAGTALLGAVLALAAPVYAQPAARPATYNLPLPAPGRCAAGARPPGRPGNLVPASRRRRQDRAGAAGRVLAAAGAGPPAGWIRPGPESGRSGPLHRLRGQDQSVLCPPPGRGARLRRTARRADLHPRTDRRDAQFQPRPDIAGRQPPGGARQCRRQRFAEPGLAGRGRPVLPRRQPLPEPVPAGRHGRHQPPGPGQQEPEPAGRQHPQQQPVVFRRHQPARGGSRLRQLRAGGIRPLHWRRGRRPAAPLLRREPPEPGLPLERPR